MLSLSHCERAFGVRERESIAVLIDDEEHVALVSRTRCRIIFDRGAPPDEAMPLLQFFDPTGADRFIQRLAICKCTPILVPSLSVN